MNIINFMLVYDNKKLLQLMNSRPRVLLEGNEKSKTKYL